MGIRDGNPGQAVLQGEEGRLLVAVAPDDPGIPGLDPVDEGHDRGQPGLAQE